MLATWPRRLGVITFALLVMGTSTGAAWAVVDDRVRSAHLPPGAVVAGVDVGDLSFDEAADLLEEHHVDTLAGTLIVGRVDGTGYSLPLDVLIVVDVEPMLQDAMRIREAAEPLDRLAWRLLGRQVDIDIPLRRHVDEPVLDEWLSTIASEVDEPAVDASRTVTDEGFAFVPAREGRVLKMDDARRAVRDTALAGGTDLLLPVDRIEPAIGEDELGLAVHVDLSERRLYLYDGTELWDRYGVAIGAPGYGTPRGEWEIVSKRYMPSWGNPGSAWAANMPAYIPPGPSNPLGTRALNLNASGIRIHGTTSDWSIGRAASHGCMRMHRWDVEELFDRVEIGTPVLITY
jgi:lipoprotein-anchoring transpeptidase ErfK/SrfK